MRNSAQTCLSLFPEANARMTADSSTVNTGGGEAGKSDGSLAAARGPGYQLSFFEPAPLLSGLLPI